MSLQPPTCRACRILRAELVRCQRESEARAAADAQRCVAMYDHMERLARFNMALTKQRKTSTTMDQSSGAKEMVVVEPRRQEDEFTSRTERVQQLQATIVQQAKELERLQRQLKSSVPLLQLDGDNAGTTTEDHDHDDASDTQSHERPRRRRGIEKLPLTSLHAQLRARDATIHRLEHYVTELTEALDANREKKRRAVAQYQEITKSQQTQLKKYMARIDEQERVQREMERELQGLQAYATVLEKKVLTSPPTRSNERTKGGY